MPLNYKLTVEDIAFCDKVLCAGAHEVKYNTLQVVEQILDENVPGDFAECGVLNGAQPAIMLYALKRRGVRDRRVHLFDSFQGIPRATEEETPEQQAIYGVAEAGKMESSGVSVSAVENTLSNLQKWGVYEPDLVVVHPGWFQDTLPGVSLNRLALLRVDVDLFESTRVVYQHLYHFVQSGGYVIDDDYGSPGSMLACRRALELVIGPQKVTHVDGQDTTVWWRK